MRIPDRLHGWVRPIFYLGRNPITLLGAVLTTSSAFTLIGFWIIDALAARPLHPYAGIVGFMILPGVFVVGLVLVPAGGLWRWLRLRRAGHIPAEYPAVDLGEPVLQRAAALVAAATAANVLLLGTASYRGLEYMDSQQFCGQACHTVMDPEYAAYLDSPHSRVHCVSCHIGPGASWFVKSKLSGARQVLAVTFKTYSRPIPSPVKHLRPARETCEACHWPQKFSGDKFVVKTKYSEDERNTPLTTVLVLKLGGRTWQGGVGIHGRHLDTRERIHYTAIDEDRNVVPRVTYIADDGSTVEYDSEEVKATPDQLARGEQRAMDCVDCHNRPTHAFDLPDRAVDRAMAEGRISPGLPWVKKKSVELLKASYPNRTVAAQAIKDGLLEYYRKEQAETYRSHRAQIEAAADTLTRIWSRNVFPDMKVTWGTHPNNIGHADFLGCFRCHDDQHKTRDGRLITQDCTACHTILAMEEENPKIISELGLAPHAATPPTPASN